MFMNILPIVKVVSEGCNMRCSYCYYRILDQSKINIMSEVTLEALIQKTINESDEKVVIVWHGGEPLLTGMSFYKLILAIEKKYLPENKQLVNGIQTNGVILNDRWARFFADNFFHVGVSCDGPQEFHDFNRKLIGGQDSFKQVYRGIKCLQNSGINPQIISVITKNSLQGVNDIFNFFRENNLSFHPKPCHEYNPETGELTEYSITPSEYSDFMIKIFDLWMNLDNSNFKIRNLFNIMIAFFGGKPNLCEFNGNCHQFLTVDFEGNVGVCDSFPKGHYHLGNILCQSWGEILSGYKYKKFIEDIAKSRKECFDCDWNHVCKGGCLRYSINKGNDKKVNQNFCQEKKRLFEHIKSHLNNI